MLSIDGKQYKGVLWDMDGLLLDSETVSMEVARGLAKDILHVELSDEEIKDKIGMVDREYYAGIIEKYKLSVDLDELISECDKRYNAQLAGVKPFPGGVELPKLLKEKGMKMALVSGSTREQIDIVLASLGLNGIMDVIISCEDYSHGKPDPEGYRLGAKRLGLAPEECIGFEDAAKGIEALNTLEALSIGVKNKGDQDISEAIIQIDSLLDFSSYLSSL